MPLSVLLLGQPLPVEPFLVFLVPLRLVGFGLGELLLHSRGGVLTPGTLAFGGVATHGHEGDHDQRNGDHGDDDPRDHARQRTVVGERLMLGSSDHARAVQS